ncbi:hypothetical protein G3I50_02920 [Streptomyces parvus]|uniref:Uncharacterized protein n=1 Tax=Streptomyces parvus TaxID=66428 RepID=A0A7K3RPZ8_9ACTN|nr:hypothetical protein [Streptomyces parvus]
MRPGNRSLRRGRARAAREFRVTHRGRALAALRPGRATELRRRLFLLSVGIHWYPFWSTWAGRASCAD